MNRSRLRLILIGLALVAVVLAILTFLSQSAEGRDKVLQEVPKITYQFLLVGILGVFVKYLVDRHQDDVAREDAIDEFRKEMVRQLVEVTHRVRRSPILIEAHRSARTYNEQMSEVIDASFALGVIRHEVDNFGATEPNRAFRIWDTIKPHIDTMEKYLSKLIAEYRNNYKSISELQLEAEKNRAFQPMVWERIESLPLMKDMLKYLARSKSDSGSMFADEFLVRYREALLLMRKQTLRVHS